MASNKGSILVIPLLILLLAAVGIAGYFYLQKQQTPTSIVERSIPIEKQDETTNWKTYTQANLYSFKYPPDVNVDNFQETIKVSKNGPTQKEMTDVYDGLSLEFRVVKIPSSDLTAYVKSVIAQSVGIQFRNEHTLLVNTYKAYYYEAQGFSTTKSYYIQHPNFSNTVVNINDYSFDPGNLGFEKTVDQILSTFKFLDQNLDTSVIPVTKLSYDLPTGWKTTQDTTGTIEVGYDPAKFHPFGNQVPGLSVAVMPNDGGAYYYIVSLDPYDNGSRQKYIWNGGQPDVKYPDYKEQDYVYNNWSCLVIYGAMISQGWTTNGMCAIGNNKAIRIGNRSTDKNFVEQVIKTIRLLK